MPGPSLFASSRLCSVPRPPAVAGTCFHAREPMARVPCRVPVGSGAGLSQAGSTLGIWARVGEPLGTGGGAFIKMAATPPLATYAVGMSE